MKNSEINVKTILLCIWTTNFTRWPNFWSVEVLTLAMIMWLTYASFFLREFGNIINLDNIEEFEKSSALI